MQAGNIKVNKTLLPVRASQLPRVGGSQGEGILSFSFQKSLYNLDK